MSERFFTVLANGCFDLLHIGHVLYLEQASDMGDYMWVSVTRDAFVNKGPGRPIPNQDDRLMVVRAQRCVNDAFLCNDALDALAQVKPDVFVKGADYIGKIEKRHADYCKAHGIEIRFTDTPIRSATHIVKLKMKELMHEYMQEL